MQNMIEEPPRKTPVKYDVDVLVVGGGSAGLAAATAAGRNGANVLLAERHGFLGGTLSMVTLGSICGLYAVTDTGVRTVVNGFAGELVERMQAMGAASGPLRWLKTASMPYDPYALRLVADRLVLDAGARCALHTTAVAAIMIASRFAASFLRAGTAVGRVERKLSSTAPVTATSPNCRARRSISIRRNCRLRPRCFVSPVLIRIWQASSLGTSCGRALRRRSVPVLICRASRAACSGPGFMHLNITRAMTDGRAPDPMNEEEFTAPRYLAPDLAPSDRHPRAWRR